MTREKDAQILAEAYRTIREEHDPETYNMVAHAIAAFGTLALVKLKELIDKKLAEKQSADASTAKIGKRLPHEITPAGTPKEPYEIGHDLSSSLRNDAAALKGKKMY